MKHKKPWILAFLAVLAICATILALAWTGHEGLIEHVGHDLFGAICFVSAIGVFPLVIWFLTRMFREPRRDE